MDEDSYDSGDGTSALDSFLGFVKGAGTSAGDIIRAFNPDRPAPVVAQPKTDFSKFLPFAIIGGVILLIVVFVAGRK